MALRRDSWHGLAVGSTRSIYTVQYERLPRVNAHLHVPVTKVHARITPPCPTGDLLKRLPTFFVRHKCWLGFSRNLSLSPHPPTTPLPLHLGIDINLGLCSGPPCKNLRLAARFAGCHGTNAVHQILVILHACKNTRNAVRQEIQVSTSHCRAPHTLFPVAVLKKNGTPPQSSAPPTSRYLRIIMLCNFEDCGPSTAHQHLIARARSSKGRWK